MPLDWDEVKPGLVPARFTLRTTPTLLAKSNASETYDHSERQLESAIRG
jgi:bifunctional non-homologous end joining protein LigD